jgi:hypothetical protein
VAYAIHSGQPRSNVPQIIVFRVRVRRRSEGQGKMTSWNKEVWFQGLVLVEEPSAGPILDDPTLDPPTSEIVKCARAVGRLTF